MQTGIIFDIREFTVHDGPGIRTTVFLKGCPLHCSWCHNPESMSPEPQTLISPTGSRVVGREYTSFDLAKLLNGQADILRANEGGVTFSGGEPLRQADFVVETIEQLNNIHVVLDTSGYGSEAAFQKLLGRIQLVFFDLKVMNPLEHIRQTGCDNAPILRNLKLLQATDLPYVIRVPLVPGVTDTDENLEAIAKAVRGSSNCLRVDLLPYNKAAGGKYAACGMPFQPLYNETQEVCVDMAIFDRADVKAAFA